DADRGVAAAPGQHAALLGMERHALHRGRQIGALVEQLPRLRVPDFDHMILSTRGQETSILAKRHAAHIISAVAERWLHDLLARHVPDADGALRTRRGQTRAIRIRTERHIPDRPLVVPQWRAYRLTVGSVSDFDDQGT